MTTDVTTDDRGRPLEPQRAEASLGELISEMTTEVSTLFRKEVELAKVETREQAARAAKAGGLLAIGGVAALLALTLLSFALAWLLDDWMPRALAFLIVGSVWAVVAAVVVAAARRRLREVQTLPETVGS